MNTTRHIRTCGIPGCPALTTRTSGRCDTHEAERRKQQDAARGTWRQRGYDREYDLNRAAVLREEHDCWLCGKPVDKTLPGTHPNGPSIDHLTRRTDGGTNHRTNLRLAHLHCNTGRHTGSPHDTPTPAPNTQPPTVSHRSIDLT